MHLAGREFPRLPPEAAGGVDRKPCRAQPIEEGRKPLVQGDSIAPGAPTELAAEPGVLVVGVDEEIIDAGEVVREAPDQVLVPLMHEGIEEAVRRRVAVGAVAVVGRAEAEERLEPRSTGHLESARDECPTRSARLGAGPAVQLGDLGRAPGHLRRRVDQVLEVERLVIGPRAPREVELDLGEAPVAQPREHLGRPRRRRVRVVPHERVRVSEHRNAVDEVRCHGLRCHLLGRPDREGLPTPTATLLRGRRSARSDEGARGADAQPAG